ncbi:MULTISPECIES: UpxY family transcription antiterminator [Sanguibacteroides]|nr:UpxY family transcription antiterminator [Sanguibacteroides justesenii]
MVNMVIRDDEKYWYAAYTRVNQEMSIKKKLDALNVENYLPLQEVVRQEPEGRKKVRELLVRGLIFLRTDRRTSFVLLNDYSLNIVYIRDRETRRSLIIPDKQMKDFMFLLDFSDEVIEIVNKELRRGDKVRVIKGPFVGLEGELVRVKGHKRVVIRLEGVVSIATSYIPGSYLEKIN